ncbi:hotdog domain-containing protein [Nocardioides zeae]|uniref:Thioesterase domain-containing protein n=1 Tax=Nocardioides zeae TaxID=1457234 RepID=A0A6P0HG16_9ACTN|nr:hotdog domain-containing protein [Nocardioides zeae]NEN77639.1 hypothetical protein [Nocardioides zeae]
MRDEVAGLFAWEVERHSDRVVARALVDEQWWAPDGRLLPLALPLGLDLALGSCAGWGLGSRWVVTSDLAVQVLRPPVPGEIRVEATLEGAGRRTAVVAALVTDGGPGVVASATGGFALAPASLDRGPFPETPVGAVRRHSRPRWSHLSPADVVAVSRAGDGRVQLGLSERTTNPFGIMHGAVSVHLALETAAVVVDDVTAVHARFLRPVTLGPAVGVVAGVHRGLGGDVAARVEVRDPVGRRCVLVDVRGQAGATG